jgi:hypothetical protein
MTPRKTHPKKQIEPCPHFWQFQRDEGLYRVYKCTICGAEKRFGGRQIRKKPEKAH